MAIPNNNIPQQSYLNRDFASIKNDLQNLLMVYYPQQWQDFSASSLGGSLIDLLAFCTDILSFNTDKRFNEMFLESSQELTSIYRLASNMGALIPTVNPAITICDFSITVPLSSTIVGPDVNYLPLYFPGVTVSSNGQSFSTTEEISFTSDFSSTGVANRTIIPNFNANQNIISYTVTKREILTAGIVKTYQQPVTLQNAQTPFFEITLPDNNVLEIVSIITKPGQNYTTTPTYSDFNNFSSQYFEVDFLAQDKIFYSDPNTMPDGSYAVGQYVMVPARFIKRFHADGTCTITFGGGTIAANAYQQYLENLPLSGPQINIQDIINNQSLGVMLPANSTLFIQYRIGGGQNSNVGTGVLTQVSNIDAAINGSNPTTNQSVIASTTCTNVIPAVGGSDGLDANSLKQYISSNYASQNRCVTLEDYVAKVSLIPGKYGTPWRIFGEVQDNKIILYCLFLDGNGKISINGLSIIKNNIISYLEPYRMLNDFVEINDGKVVNIAVNASVFTDKKFNPSDIKLHCLNALAAFFDTSNANFNQNIYVSQVSNILNAIPGVINVIDIEFSNMTGGNYSSTLISQANGLMQQIGNGTYSTNISLLNNTIYGTQLSVFEVRYPQTDISVSIS